LPDLPAGLLRSLSTPLGGRGSSGIPAGSGSRRLAPLTTAGGGREACGSRLPLTSGGEARLNGGNTLLLDTGKLLLLNLLLSLGLRVTV